MKLRTIVTLIVFFIGGIMLFNFLPAREKPVIVGRAESMSIQEEVVAPLQEDEGYAETKHSTAERSLISQAEIKKMKRNYPLRSEVEREFKAAPHGPSPSLMNFAKDLGPLMEKAYSEETSAKMLTQEFTNCALDESIHKAARALCIQDIEALSNNYPEISPIAKNLRTQVSEDVLKILRVNDALKN